MTLIIKCPSVRRLVSESKVILYPTNVQVMAEKVPPFIRDIPQWLMWRWVRRGTKTTKPPFTIDNKPASPTDPNTWSTYDEVIHALDTKLFSGIGIVLTADLGIVAWDLDHCINTKSGELEQWAQNIVDSLNSYTEITPSGEGLRVLIRGTVPQDGRKRGPIECYKDKRYVTITGQHYPHTPTDIKEVDCTKLWESIFKGKAEEKEAIELIDSQKIELLKQGKYEEAGFKSHSEADLSFCYFLAHEFEGDPKKIDEAFRKSPMFRPKWDELRGEMTYGEKTITAAIKSYKPFAYHLTDTGNAKRFAKLVQNDVRFCNGKWYIWDTKRLKEDDLQKIYLFADRVVQQIYNEASETQDADRKKQLYQWGKQVESRARIESMLKLVQAREPIPIRVEELDKDKMALNCDNGVLVNGQLMPHSFDAMMTKLSPVSYDLKSEAPVWQSFLDKCVPDPEMQRFLARAVGYSLTGSVKEQKLFFVYGTGANGKSTFINVIMEVLGEYARYISSDVFIAKNNETHPTALADLLGVRMAVCPELEEGKRFNEQALKWITGGEKIKARRMFQDFFEFENTAKIWIIGNHKPNVRGTDFAIWRRILLVPFTETIPEAEQDKDLPEKLKAEMQGILNWCVAGLKDWAANGINPPKSVLIATEEYRQEQDIVANFLAEDGIQVSGDLIAAHKDLYAKYAAIAKENNEFVLSSKAFANKLRDRRFETFRGTNNIMFWRGIGITDKTQKDLGGM